MIVVLSAGSIDAVGHKMDKYTDSLFLRICLKNKGKTSFLGVNIIERKSGIIVLALKESKEI